MGTRNPDRVSLAVRRRRCETVSDMIAQHWDVLARCRRCELLMRVNLQVVAALMGASFSLWNRTTRCRRVGCSGAMEFQAKAPGMGWHEPLQAPWPDGKPPQSELRGQDRPSEGGS